MTEEKAKHLKNVIRDAQAEQSEVNADIHEALNDIEKGLLLFEYCINGLVRCNGLLADTLKELIEEGDAE